MLLYYTLYNLKSVEYLDERKQERKARRATRRKKLSSFLPAIYIILSVSTSSSRIRTVRIHTVRVVIVLGGYIVLRNNFNHKNN